ncbi:hypothetical protein OGAPHI_000801 [Ogataea philodendri]|uniref:Uncharacterized protein n=1 Tax=Ogataea philodendri TaxID=1378263 RepID=A0A9P8TA84_9ASCO|nr:uncharacterized protein OGAPHI_000801 [Ogataea philodendri]KAH3671090.1 hypothetical protein OGAPHI_000801 [Ogataea philodendri]
MLLRADFCADEVIFEMSTAPLASAWALAVASPERASKTCGFTRESSVLVAESVALFRIRAMLITFEASYAPPLPVAPACRLLMVARPDRTSSKSYSSCNADLAGAFEGFFSTDAAASCDSTNSDDSTSSS